MERARATHRPSTPLLFLPTLSIIIPIVLLHRRVQHGDQVRHQALPGIPRCRDPVQHASSGRAIISRWHRVTAKILKSSAKFGDQPEGPSGSRLKTWEP
ncbi:uncharacterized protein FMAN_14131 [Fusarium mangiferae]|uniref:Uncharacterized protein n=1 Tax=Fusarium mangiferae TaxID=192010 RepID=A0A1L7UJL9_FUSMA|nr:uncharacterized protein FMAN_14131 [Fusarium mangiferae]CVL08255.1 uncharacterized protein FMAN_14131 [Fusarium mangiferae]